MQRHNFMLFIRTLYIISTAFPGGSVGKVSACNTGDSGRSLGQEDLLEKKMVTYSSILAWRSPWTEEPDGLQSMGSYRVRHDWGDWARTRVCEQGKLAACYQVGWWWGEVEFCPSLIHQTCEIWTLPYKAIVGDYIVGDTSVYSNHAQFCALQLLRISSLFCL